ncbi:MAG: hypothetical protein ACE5PM_06295 [Candidatus Hydrothermarchaeales archaeon]
MQNDKEYIGIRKFRIGEEEFKWLLGFDCLWQVNSANGDLVLGLLRVQRRRVALPRSEFGMIDVQNCIVERRRYGLDRRACTKNTSRNEFSLLDLKFATLL